MITYDLSPITICEEFLWGITMVGEGRRLRKALGLYGSSGFLIIPAWWWSLVWNWSLKSCYCHILCLLSMRYLLLCPFWVDAVSCASLEGYTDGHAIWHQNTAAWSDLCNREGSAWSLNLVVMMNSHFLVSFKNLLHSLCFLFSEQVSRSLNWVLWGSGRCLVVHLVCVKLYPYFYFWLLRLFLII